MTAIRVELTDDEIDQLASVIARTTGGALGVFESILGARLADSEAEVRRLTAAVAALADQHDGLKVADELRAILQDSIARKGEPPFTPTHRNEVNPDAPQPTE